MERNSIKWFSHSGRRFIYPVGDVYGDFDINCQWWSWWCLQWWVVVGQVWMLRQLFRHKLSGSAERSQRRSPKYKLYFWLFGFGICISVWGTFPTQIVGEKSAAVAKISPENFDHIVSRPFLSKNWRNCANFQPQGPKTHLPPTLPIAPPPVFSAADNCELTRQPHKCLDSDTTVLSYDDVIQYHTKYAAAAKWWR